MSRLRAVHQRAATPEGHAVVEAEGLEAAAVEQGVVPYLLQHGGQRQVRQAAVVPLGLFIREAAGDQHLLPLRSGGGGGREGVAPQLRHRPRPNSSSRKTARSSQVTPRRIRTDRSSRRITSFQLLTPLTVSKPKPSRFQSNWEVYHIFRPFPSAKPHKEKFRGPP